MYVYFWEGDTTKGALAREKIKKRNKKEGSRVIYISQL